MFVHRRPFVRLGRDDLFADGHGVPQGAAAVVETGGGGDRGGDVKLGGEDRFTQAVAFGQASKYIPTAHAAHKNWP